MKPRGVDILAPKDNFYASSGVHTRQEFIPVGVFDGSHLPFPDASYDIVSVMSTLHHAANNTPSLVAESMRDRQHLIIPDCANQPDRLEQEFRAACGFICPSSLMSPWSVPPFVPAPPRRAVPTIMASPLCARPSGDSERWAKRDMCPSRLFSPIEWKNTSTKFLLSRRSGRL